MQRLRRSAATLLAATLLAAAPLASRAVEPDEMLADPGLEARARALSLELRCLVCQNQSIDDSNAPLARDLRILLRERIQAGDSDDEVKQFIVGRYGSFVLLKPPFGPATLLLWLAPAALLAGAAGVLVHRFRAARRRDGGTLGPLTGEEEERLRKLLAGAERGTADGPPP